MGLFDTLGSASFLGPIGGALVSGIGSYIGTNQQNAQSVKNIWEQGTVNSMMMDAQNTYNNAAMDKQFGLNSRAMEDQYGYNSALMEKQAGINQAGAQWQFDRSQQQLREVEDYNTSMANTAYQRMRADMRAAGFNPILGMASGGSATPGLSANAVGAPSVGGASVGALGVGAGGVSGQSVGMPQTQSAIGNAIASAMQGSKLFSALRQAGAEADNTETSGKILQSQANYADDIQRNIKDKSYFDAVTARITAKNADAVGMSQAAQNNANASSAAGQARLNDQAYKNDVSGAKYTTTFGFPRFGLGATISGPAGQVLQYTSPKTPSTSVSTPSMAQPGYVPVTGFARQGLWAVP